MNVFWHYEAPINEHYEPRKQYRWDPAKQRLAVSARGRALRRLALEYEKRFTEILNEERQAVGLPSNRHPL